MRITVLIADLREPGLQGKWIKELRLIIISNRLTVGEATAVLAHELTHAKLGHHGRQPAIVEALVDEIAAAWLITRYDRAAIQGMPTNEAAARLGVPVWLLEAHRRLEALNSQEAVAGE